MRPLIKNEKNGASGTADSFRSPIGIRDPNFAARRPDEMYGPSPRSSVWLLLTGGSLQRVHGDIGGL